MIENQRFSEIILTLPAHAQTKLDTPFDLSFSVYPISSGHQPQSALPARPVNTPLKWVWHARTRLRGAFYLRRTLSSSIFPDRAPDGYALLTVFVGGDRTPERAHLPEAELIARVETDLQNLLVYAVAHTTYRSVVGSRLFHNIPKRSKRATANSIRLKRIFQAFILPETIEVEFPLRTP